MKAQKIAAMAAFTFAIFALGANAVAANVAVIDSSNVQPTEGPAWCQFLQDNGHQCTVLPASGPTLAQLAPFDVIIDLSEVWSDPDGVLGDAIRARKGVVTWGIVPDTLQVFSNPVVQAWIGANSGAADEGPVVTTDYDPIFGSRPPGTTIRNCLTPCRGVYDTSGHPQARALAVFSYHPDRIAILRNTWGGGESAYLSDLAPSETGSGPEIILKTVEVLSHPIPAVSPAALIVMPALLTFAGVRILRGNSLGVGSNASLT